MKIVICYGIWPSVDDGGFSVSPLLPNNFLYFFVELRHFTFLQIHSNFGYSFYGLVYPESKIYCTMQTIPTAKKFKSQLKVLRTRTHQVIQECLSAVPQVAE